MLQWKLQHYLDSHGITPYKLWKESGLARPTVYDMASNRAKGVKFDVFHKVMSTLETITGQPVTPNDLLEVIEEPLEDNEERDLLNASMTDMGRALDELEKDIPKAELNAWLEANRKAAKPAKYIVGQGIVLLEATA